MLILLTSIYCAIIWLVFIKLKWLPWNKKTQVAAVAVGVVGLIAVIIGFGMGAPVSSGGVMIQADVMRIAAHSQGRVTKVYAGINEPLKRGDPIFEVDRAQYEIAVRAAESSLRQATYGVQQLKAAWEQTKANSRVVVSEQTVLESAIAAARANVESARAGVQAAEHALGAYEADVAKSKVDVEIGTVQRARIEDLVRQNVESQDQLDRATRTVEGYKAALDRAVAMEKKGQDDLDRTKGQLEGAEASLKQTEDSRQSLEAQLAQAKAAERQAHAAAELDGEGEHSSVRAARESLANAKYDLDNCVVVAPTDGYLLALGIVEGNYVRMTQVGTFVSTQRYWATAVFSQNSIQYIEPGMKAEFALRQYPGKILAGSVHSVSWGSGEAQLPQSGTLPQVNAIQMPRRTVVRFQVAEFPDEEPPRFGSSGSVAVYTEFGKPVHVVRKIILRIESLLNWIPG